MYRNVVVDQTDTIRILHVDDDMSQGEFLKYFLPVSDGTFSINAVNDPNQALKELRASRYDCVVTDYVMPKLNGIELSTMIRKEFDVPIIIYTGQGSEEVAEAAFSVGIDDYMRKEMDPSHYQVLAKRIRNVVEKKRIDTLYKTIIEETKESIIISVDNKIEFINKSTVDILGINGISDLKGDQFNFLKHAEKKSPLNGDNKNIYINNDHIQSKHKLRKKDGTYIIVDTSSNLITYNGKIGLLTLLRNITEQEKLMLEKRESQERYQALVELAPDGIMTLNLRGIITSINPAFERLTGYNRDDFVGKHFMSMKTLRNIDMRNFVSLFKSVLIGNVPPPFEFKYVRSDKTTSWGEAHCALITISGKHELLIIARDIGERKKQQILDDTSTKPDYVSPTLDNDLLVSIAQLGYLVNEEILTKIRDANEVLESYLKTSKMKNEKLLDVNIILDQTLMMLDEFIKITGNTVLNPNKNIFEIISDIVTPIEKLKKIKINVKKSGEGMFVLFDIDLLDRVLTTLLNELFELIDVVAELDIIFEIQKDILKICIKNVIDAKGKNYNRHLIEELKENPEVNLTKDYLSDYGGMISYDDNAQILIKIPTYKISTQSKEAYDAIRKIVI